MKGGIEEAKEISPMFPRLHVKDAEKGGPKAPPRNKMALYEQFTIPSQSFVSGSPSKFPPLLKNIHSTSGHVNLVGSGQGIQFCNSSVSSLADKIHAYHARSINLTKLVPDGFTNCNNSLKEYEHEDAFITPVSANGRNSCCSISQNKEDEDKHAHCKSNCSLKSQNSFSKKANLTRPVKLKSARYGKNQIEDHTEVNQGDHKPEEGFALQLAGFGDMTDESSISTAKVRTPHSMKKGHASSMEEFRGISVDSLKMLQGSNSQTNGEHAAAGDKIDLRDGYLEKPVLSDVREYPDGLEIGRKCFWSKGDRHKSEDVYRHYDDALNKPISVIGLDITPDDVLGVIGEKQFWKARRTIINQQRIFVMQLFELHRLIKVQKLFAGSPHLLVEDNPLDKPSLKVSAAKKLQSDNVIEQPFSNAKENDSKSEKPTTTTTTECVESIPLPGVNNNMSKDLSDQLSNYGPHSRNHHQLALSATTNNIKPSPCYIYPAPGNQWLVPYMSPSEGLIYKPFLGTCPPSAGFMGPLYGACSPISLTPGSKDVSDATHVPCIFPPCGPPVMHPSISAFAHEQISPASKMQSNGATENHQSAGDVNSGMLYQNSSNMSSQMSQAMSKHVINDNQPSEDKELQTSTASSPSKRMKGDALPLFPIAPTFWASSDHQKEQAVEEHQPRIIKAIPHNPNSTTESAARIFRSIQEERKHL